MNDIKCRSVSVELIIIQRITHSINVEPLELGPDEPHGCTGRCRRRRDSQDVVGCSDVEKEQRGRRAIIQFTFLTVEKLLKNLLIVGKLSYKSATFGGYSKEI